MRGLTQTEEWILVAAVECDGGPPLFGSCRFCKMDDPAYPDLEEESVQQLVRRGLIVIWHCEVKFSNVHVHVPPIGRLVLALMRQSRAA